LSEKPKPTLTDEVKNTNRARARIYNFLSLVYRLEVDEMILELIMSTEQTIGIINESKGSAELAECTRLLSEFTTEINGMNTADRERLFTELAVDFASMFLGTGRNPVSLVETFYLRKSHLLYAKPRHVTETYKSVDFEKARGFAEPEDHIAVEFEFMSNLSKRIVQALETDHLESAIAYLSLQKEFLGEHMSTWIPEVCQKIRGTATSTFYRTIAHLTHAFINAEKQMPDQLMEKISAEIERKLAAAKAATEIAAHIEEPNDSSVQSMS
jgi:putative dimethyl sulfoxide reductase chaperone